MRVLALAATIGALLAPAPARAELEEIIVTAQRREESAQDVPIALTAFDESALTARQIGSFGDFRFNTPNASFSKGNFTNTNFSIRGIGNTVVAAGSDSGVEVSVNEVPILFPRLFETEFFDVQQVAVLRGPQGTLYGRNSTGGAVNMVTNAAMTGESGGSLTGQFGNYSSTQLQAALNLALGERLAVRFAGIDLQHDGYTRNIAPGGDDVDDRKQYAVRGSLRFEPGPNTALDLMASWFKEDSSRTRSQKQMCHNDPSAVLGCLPDRLAYETVNGLAQLTGVLPDRLGPFGPTPGVTNVPDANPDDLREVALDFTPIYQADETLLTLRLRHETDHYTLTAVAGYQDTTVDSLADYTSTLGQQSAVSPLVQALFPTTYATYFAAGCLPISAPSKTGTGIVGGHVGGCTTTLDGYDQSNQKTDQRSLELRVASNYGGAFDFLFGGFYMKARTFNEYWVLSNGLDYFAVVYPAVARLLHLPRTPAGVGDGYALVAPSYLNRTNDYTLESSAVFGEAYFQLGSTTRLTLGLRRNVDDKHIDDVQHLYDQYLASPSDTDESFVFVPFGFDATIPDAPPRLDDKGWKETTGRVVLDWTPELRATDATLVYLSYSRGYKGGGFNPPFDHNLFPDTAATFDPEYVDAIEIGTKNQLRGNTLQANLAAFAYDYQGLQISRIVNRTSFNENADARIFGAEAEFLFAPDAHWQFNASLAYLNTEVRDFSSVDSRDPADGRNGIDVTLVKDNETASNCVIHHNGAPAPTIPGLPFYSCDDLRDDVDIAGDAIPSNGPHRLLTDPRYTVDEGVAVGLSGNSLINSPEWTLGAGAQYTITLPADHALTVRVDYYWQDSMYGRIYNKPIDHIDAWDVWNAQATLNSADKSWFLRAFVKNIEDDANVVGMYVTDPSSGLFTNLFLIEPRTYGIAAGYNF